jgi:hypothetical protein
MRKDFSVGKMMDEITQKQITRVRMLLGEGLEKQVTDQHILIVLAWHYPTEAAEIIRKKLTGEVNGKA